MKFIVCTLLLVALATFSVTDAVDSNRELTESYGDYDSLDFVNPEMESEDEDFDLEDSVDEDEEDFDEDEADSLDIEDEDDEDSIDEEVDDEDRLTTHLKKTAKKIKCMAKHSCRVKTAAKLCRKTRQCKKKWHIEELKYKAFHKYYTSKKCGSKSAKSKAGKVCYFHALCHALHYKSHVVNHCKGFVSYMHSPWAMFG